MDQDDVVKPCADRWRSLSPKDPKRAIAKASPLIVRPLRDDNRTSGDNAMTVISNLCSFFFSSAGTSPLSSTFERGGGWNSVCTQDRIVFATTGEET